MSTPGNNDKKHLPFLQQVADEDVRFVKEKDASYGSSWKQRGGVGAFMMLARKWDRLDNMLKVWSVSHPGGSDYDVFAGIAADYSGADGSILAEVRDLRRYLMLCEAEMLAQQQTTKVVVIENPGSGWPRALKDEIYLSDDWTGKMVRFTPSAAGLAGKTAEMIGEVITDIDGWLKIQCGPGLDALYNEPKSVCSLYDFKVRGTDMADRLVPRYDYQEQSNQGAQTAVPAEDSNKHAERNQDDLAKSNSHLGFRGLITKTAYDKLSDRFKRMYIPTGENCQLNRSLFAEVDLVKADLPRHPTFYHQEDVRGLPAWVLEMYNPAPDGYHLKPEFIELWGKKAL